MQRKKVLIGIFLLLMVVLSYQGFKHYQNQQAIQRLLANTGRTTSDTKRSEDEQLKIIENYPEVAAAFAATAKKNANRMFAIPGLYSSLTMELLKNQPVICHDMTPQGVTASKDYLYISEYCHTHEHHSVVQQLDRKTKKLIKTLVVPDIPHLGGLGYDQKHDYLWLATDSPTGATLSRLTQETIQHYDPYDQPAPIKYDEVVSVWNVLKASLISYQPSMMTVGYFSKGHGGQLALYPIDQKGNLTSLIEDTKDISRMGQLDSKNVVTQDSTNLIKKSKD